MRPDSGGEAKVAALPWGRRAELGRTPASAPLRLSARALDWVKWAALFTMVLDHANKIVFDGGLPWMTWIGRMAYPLFAFLIAYNLEVRGADWRKYAWRLGLAAAVSQPVYFYALAGNLNIFFTLLAGVLVWAAARRLHTSHNPLYFVLMAAVLLPAYYLDYRWFGVLLIGAWAWMVRDRGQPPLRWAAVGVAMLLMNGWFKSSLFALLALGLVWALSRVRFGEVRAVRSRWATFGFYAFYPLHLLALALVGGWRV